jgi:hypothetical protein
MNSAGMGEFQAALRSSNNTTTDLFAHLRPQMLSNLIMNVHLQRGRNF